ncbi:MAG TPA: GPW/gp25 family protein [Longimicrobiaceae bacterium]|jgi:phage baseplate assembly protein W|nr:GPW/gp25 family protein [Longimicrobiaceae bacterium]
MRDELVGRGWAFPVRPGPDGRLPLRGGERKIRESIWLILATAPGERVMRPAFGAGLPGELFAPNDPRRRALLATRAREALVRDEPRIDVLDVRADPDPDEEGRVLVQVDYRVRDNNAVFNLVYPVYLTEGAA